MHFGNFLSLFIVNVVLSGTLVASASLDRRGYNPDLALPLYSSGRWVFNSKGETVTYVGANWPGAADVMIPEGLQYQSVSHIAGMFAEAGLNSVRLTYAIELVDQIYENHGKDVSIKTALVEALGSENGTQVYHEILKHNPSFHKDITRLEVYDAIAEELYGRGIYLHLDNHISKGMWCCSTDGNGWFNDTYFDIDNWLRGWKYMASHGKKWKALASVGLRNELRAAVSEYALPINFEVWTEYMTKAAEVVHHANSDVLIFFSGLNYDTNLHDIVYGNALSDSTNATFDIREYDFYHKAVFELHTYSSPTDCESYWSGLYNAGFASLNESDTDVANRLPVVLSEWGHSEEDSSLAYESVYSTCLHEKAVEYKFGWMLWSMIGGYYVRSGSQDNEDLWGLLAKNETVFRGVESADAIITMAKDTLASDVDEGVSASRKHIKSWDNYKA
ncbi:glycoside hydrolase superfamily [Myxozyma melibiosi]|uniref:Glycoside hydrolase superfamily n=1 Tax=Myxozyma melibiosi TaxID=54550 RepID=A0ABR1F1T4_9ASCO